jgi:hypothetical protein
MPEQKQDEGHHGGFQQPDGDRPQTAQHAMVTSDVPQQQPGRRRNGHGHRPQGPRSQQYELPLMKNSGRIFEEELEHEI